MREAIKTATQAAKAATLTGGLFVFPFAIAFLAGLALNFAPLPVSDVVAGDGTGGNDKEVSFTMPDVAGAKEDGTGARAAAAGDDQPVTPTETASLTTVVRKGYTVQNSVRLVRSSRGAKVTDPDPDARSTKVPKSGGTDKGKQCRTDDGITRVGTNHFQVARAWVDANKSNRSVGRLDWAETDEGKKVGFSVDKIGCGPLAKIGLRNGDVVTSINGKRVRTLLKAAMVANGLRDEDRIVLKLTRGGKPMALVYDITG